MRAARARKVVAVIGASAAVVATVTVGPAVASVRGDQPSPIVRGAHVSGVMHHLAANPHKPPGGGGGGGSATSCSQPGSTNYMTDCKSGGRPVNETAIASNGSLLVAGANDYNSYNGQGQNGFYWSTNGGSSWYDNGPINVFPQNQNNGAGDPGVAVANGDVYYSSLLFNFYRCSTGGVELLYAKAPSGSTAPSWSYIQLEANSSSALEDKPAMTVSGSNLYVSWTHFGSCSGSNVKSPLHFEKFSVASGTPTGGSGVLATVPNSTYSQGSALAPDGSGGFWIAWEEYPSATATVGQIQLAHYTTSGWATLGNNATYEVISPAGFTDLPSPLPGFSFRDNSFPSIAVVGGAPEVVWASYDSGHGRAYLWKTGTVSTVATPVNGGDQFFASIDSNGSIAFSEGSAAYTTVASTNSYVQRLVSGGTASTVSTGVSEPNQDLFFSGQFIGDYNETASYGSADRPAWADIRGTDCCYSGTWQMNSMTHVG